MCAVSLARPLTSGPAIVAVLTAAFFAGPTRSGELAARQAAVPRPGPPPATVWHLEGEGHGRPASDEDTAYFLSKRHEVVAVAAAGGAARWARSTAEPGDSTEGSALVLAGPVVVAGDYNLVGLDRATGSVRWRFVPALGYGPGVYLGEASGNFVLAGSPAGRLYAVSSATGELAWSATVANDGRTTVFPPVTDGAVVAAGYTTFLAPNTGGVVLLDAHTGRELWRAAFRRAAEPFLGTGSTGGPVLTPSAVVASSGDGTVYAFSRRDGSILWTLPPVSPRPLAFQIPGSLAPAAAGADYRPLARNGQTLFAGSLNGRVVAYDMTTRRERWSYADPRSGSVSFALVTDGRSVYVPFVSGIHVALDASTGRERWRTADAKDAFNWPAAPAGDRVYLAGGKGGFVAVRQ